MCWEAISHWTVENQLSWRCPAGNWRVAVEEETFTELVDIEGSRCPRTADELFHTFHRHFGEAVGLRVAFG